LLSIKWHPDKNVENKDAAAQKFMEIQKAYKALTDETARKNWEEYGNPDGPKGFSLGIALPAWLVGSTGNKALVLLVYALSFGIALPWIVAKTWTRSKMFTRDRIRHTTMGLFFKELKDSTTAKTIVELLACASEFEQSELLKKKAGKDSIPLPSDYAVPKMCKTPVSERVHALLYAHFHRLELKDDVDQEDRATIVTTSLQLVLGMLQIAIAREWFNCAKTLMGISQVTTNFSHHHLCLASSTRSVE
jgi:translocation protein SEC63